MRVAIVGTHSTGKSTLLKRLESEFPNFFFSDSSTRRSTTPDERRLSKVSDEVQNRIFESIKEQEKELEEIEKQTSIFMDRSFIDFTAYTVVFWQDDLVSEKFKDKILKECSKRLESNLYDIIFYLPIEFGIIDDGIRNTNKTLQYRVDAEIRKLLKSGKNVVEVKGGIYERIEFIKEYLKL